MKKIVAIIIVIMLIGGIATAEGRLYPRFGNVIDIEYDTDFVTVDDGMGNLWDFYGVDFYFYGDLVVLTMSDNGTPNWVYDDSVEDARKCTIEEAYEIIREFRELQKNLYFSFKIA